MSFIVFFSVLVLLATVSFFLELFTRKDPKNLLVFGGGALCAFWFLLRVIQIYDEPNLAAGGG